MTCALLRPLGRNCYCHHVRVTRAHRSNIRTVGGTFIAALSEGPRESANSSLSSYYTCVAVRSYRVSLQMSCASVSGWVIPLRPGLSGRNVLLSVSSRPLGVEPVLWGTCGLGVVAPAGASLLVVLDFFILLDSVESNGRNLASIPIMAMDLLARLQQRRLELSRSW